MAPKAPPIQGQVWLTTEPLTPAHLEGKTTVLVFWTVGCEASLQRLRDLQNLVERLDPSRQNLAFIALHCPRYSNIDNTELIKSVLGQHRLSPIVVHDPDYLSWNNYNPQGWPTTVLISSQNQVLGMQPGAAQFASIANRIEVDLNYSFKRRRDDIVQPLPTPSLKLFEGGVLKFPSGVATSGDRLAIADTGNNRVLVGRVKLENPQFIAEAEITGLAEPKALAWDRKGRLLVLEAAAAQLTRLSPEQPDQRLCLYEDLIWPTALTAAADGGILVSDAGREQILKITEDHDSTHCAVIAGNGTSGHSDGPALRAKLCQPSGLVETVEGLVFCDSGSSSLRMLNNANQLVTLNDGSPYNWGLLDGELSRARMQHPMDLCLLGNGTLIIADTGNQRLRRVEGQKMTTLGMQDLTQPYSIANLNDHHIVVADPYNHRVVSATPERRMVWDLTIDTRIPVGA